MVVKAAMVVAHPGHELRVHHWLELARPLVFVLTDGSGRTGHARVEATSRVLEGAGAQRGQIFGRWTDRSVYRAIEAREIERFVETVQNLADAFASADITYVAGDAIEGYNPTHDLCRYLIDATVALVEKNRNRSIKNYEFLLVGRPDQCPASLRDNAIQVELNQAALERKLAAAQQYTELKPEVDAAVEKFGIAMFATEYLLPASPLAALNKFKNSLPYYETYGEQQVAAGHYKSVIRYAEHVEPLVQSLWKAIGLTLPRARDQ